MPAPLPTPIDVAFPLFAFSHCRDVVAAVSRAGGFGVLGAATFTPQRLAEELRWITEHAGGRPFGVDLLIPENVGFDKSLSGVELAAQMPRQHVAFARRLLDAHGVSAHADDLVDRSEPTYMPKVGEALLEIAFQFPIRLIVNALGVPPPRMIELGRRHGVPVGALAGSVDHALRHVEVGADVVIAQGAEAGGHCGEVTTLVLVTEVVRALPQTPVLAAGGIVTGQQMAACMAMGAAGAWTGTVWLATAESDLSPVLRDRIVAAASRDTVRSQARTGKFSRQLRSAWHAAWDGPDSPGVLPMPLMGMLSEPSFGRIVRSAEAGNPRAVELASYFAGQGVGLIDEVSRAGNVVQRFKEDFAAAFDALSAAMSRGESH